MLFLLNFLFTSEHFIKWIWLKRLIRSQNYGFRRQRTNSLILFMVLFGSAFPEKKSITVCTEILSMFSKLIIIVTKGGMTTKWGSTCRLYSIERSWNRQGQTPGVRSLYITNSVSWIWLLPILLDLGSLVLWRSSWTCCHSNRSVSLNLLRSRLISCKQD